MQGTELNDPQSVLDRENPLPLVEPSLERLYQEPHSVRERRLGRMALGSFAAGVGSRGSGVGGGH